MIRRTLKSGLLATVAVLVFLPAAAGAAPASATTAYPVPDAIAQQHVGHTHPAPYRAHHRRYSTHHLHHRTHHMYRFIPQTAAYRWAAQEGPCRGAAHRTPHRFVRRATGRVAISHGRLNVRSGPGTGYRVIGHRHANRLVGLTCRTRGSWVDGNRTWYRLAHHRGYVSARYVRADRALPWC